MKPYLCIVPHAFMEDIHHAVVLGRPWCRKQASWCKLYMHSTTLYMLLFIVLLTLYCVSYCLLELAYAVIQGARALRFVRKVPLLKGLSDNDLLRVAGRMPERVYDNEAALITYGERGDEMYLIRYGKVGKHL